MRARAPAKTLRAQRTYWTPPRMMTAPLDQASASAWRPSSSSIASAPPRALRPPAAAPGAALDVGFVSRVGAIGGFAIQRLEVVVVAVDDVAVVATVLLEVRLFRASREAGGLVVAVVATELAIVRRGGRAGCLITLAVAGGFVIDGRILVAGVPIGVAGALLGEV